MGRTQSAVSMQVRRLEDTLGQRVFNRGKGGLVELTTHGRYLLERARRILALNDEVISTFLAPRVAGTVRLGCPDDYALAYIPPILRRFAETHPAVQVEVRCSPSGDLTQGLQARELDLALLSDGHQPAGWPFVTLWRGPLAWVTALRHSPHLRDPLPLAIADPTPGPTPGRRHPCEWTTAAIAALERAGRPYRIAYVSASQLGTHVPVVAGLAVTVSSRSWLPEGSRALGADEGLPPLPDCGILLLKSPDAVQPVTDVLASHIEASFRAGTHAGHA